MIAKEFIPSWFSDMFTSLAGSTFIASARASLDFPSIGAGLQAVLTIATPGALLGDVVAVGVETVLEAGLALPTAQVTAADTTTVYLANHTAGAIDPSAKNFQVIVSRRAA